MEFTARNTDKEKNQEFDLNKYFVNFTASMVRFTKEGWDEIYSIGGNGRGGQRGEIVYASARVYSFKSPRNNFSRDLPYTLTSGLDKK
jgi:hypothetical protein